MLRSEDEKFSEKSPKHFGELRKAPMMTEYLNREEVKSEEQASRVMRGFWGAVSAQVQQQLQERDDEQEPLHLANP